MPVIHTGEAMHRDKFFQCFDRDAQAGGILPYAIMLTSVVAIMAITNASRGDINKKIKEKESMHLFLQEINKTMRGQVNCPAGGITISPDSCPGSPSEPVVNPIKLSIEQVRRLIMEEEGRQNIPVSKRTTGHNARNAIVRTGISDYANCRLNASTLAFSADSPTLSSPTCIYASNLKSLEGKPLTTQVKYVQKTILPAISSKIRTTSSASPSLPYYQAMENHIQTRILSVDEQLILNTRLAELGASPTAIEILISQGQSKLQEWLVNPSSRIEDGKIPAYPLLLEPACYATPIPGTSSPTQYLRRLILKAEVDPQLSTTREKQIKDLARFDLKKGSQKLMPVGLGPDCVIQEEDDDESAKVGSANKDEDENEDAKKNDQPKAKTKASSRKRVPNNRY